MGGISLSMLLVLAMVIALLFGTIGRRGAHPRAAGDEVALDTIFATHLSTRPKRAVPSTARRWPAIAGLILLALIADQFSYPLITLNMLENGSPASGLAVTAGAWLSLAGALAAGLLAHRVPPQVVLFGAALVGCAAAMLAMMAAVPVGLAIAATYMAGSCAWVTVLLLVATSGLTRPLVIAVIAFADGSGLWNQAINAATDSLGGSEGFASYDMPDRARSSLTLMLMVAALAIPIAFALLRRLPVRQAFAGSAHNPLRDRELWLPIGVALAAAVAVAAARQAMFGIDYEVARTTWAFVPYVFAAGTLGVGLFNERAWPGPFKLPLLGFAGGAGVLAWFVFAGGFDPAVTLLAATGLLGMWSVPFITHLLERWGDRPMAIALVYAVRGGGAMIPGFWLSMRGVALREGGTDQATLALAAAGAAIALLLAYRARVR